MIKTSSEKLTTTTSTIAKQTKSQPFFDKAREKGFFASNNINFESRKSNFKVGRDYVIFGNDANTYDIEPPHKPNTEKIPQGHVVQILAESKDKKYVKVKANNSSITFMKVTDIELITTVNNDDQYTIAYNDVFVYKDPVGKIPGSTKKSKTTFKKKTKTENSKNINETIAENTIVKISFRYRNFVNIKAINNSQNYLGWIYEGDLISKSKADRREYLKKYKAWLEVRLVEIKAFDTKQMLVQAKAFLGEIEKTSIVVNSIPPIYPNIDEMEIEPKFEENASRSFVPPELIGITRQFILLLESAVPLPKDPQNSFECSDNNIPGGSLYDDIDWNKRLGVPQYRTQSDNLLSPEATCVPTSYAMILERLGINRKDLLDTIDSNLKKNNQNFNQMAKIYFETEESVRKALDTNAKRNKMLKENLKAKSRKQPVTFKPEEIPAEMVIPPQPNEGKDYQRLRGSQGGMIGKEESLSGLFREKGQTEDLLGFLGFILGYSERQEIGLKTINKIAKINGSEFTEEIFNSWSGDVRSKMKETLDEGGAILLSISHKSGRTGGHVITVQQVTNTGLIVDDPYGGGNTDYKWTNIKSQTDFYAPNNSSKRSYLYKNKSFYSPNDSIGNQDFWLTPGQNLVASESLGDSKFIPFEIIDNNANFINRVHLFKRVMLK